MATMTSRRGWVFALAVAFFAPAALIGACSDDNSNPTPTPPVYQVGNDSGSNPTPTPDSGNGNPPPDDSGPQGNPDAPLTQLDGALVGDAAVCTTDAGCWSCTPVTSGEFLNQCTASHCSPFVNALRLPNYDGGLPPLN
jgi:hypothetical protein